MSGSDSSEFCMTVLFINLKEFLASFPEIILCLFLSSLLLSNLQNFIASSSFLFLVLSFLGGGGALTWTVFSMRSCRCWGFEPWQTTPITSIPFDLSFSLWPSPKTMTTSTDHQGRSFGQKREKGGGADLLAGGDDDGSTLEAQSLGDSESDPLGGCRHDRHFPSISLQSASERDGATGVSTFIVKEMLLCRKLPTRVTKRQTRK